MATRVVFCLSVSRPVSTLKLTRSALHRGRVAHGLTHTSRQMRDGHHASDTLTQHHARTVPSLSLTERVPPLFGYLPHHLIHPLLFGSVPHRPSPRHCSTRLTADARLTKTFVSTVSLSSPSGVSWSSLWLAGGRGGNRIRRIHGRELQQRVQLGLRGRTLCLSGDAPWWHGGRGPSTAARKHRHRP